MPGASSARPSSSSAKSSAPRCPPPSTRPSAEPEILQLRPERRLEELPRRGARDLLEEDVGVGQPVPGEARLQVFAKVLLGGLRPFLEHDARDRPLVPLG